MTSLVVLRRDQNRLDRLAAFIKPRACYYREITPANFPDHSVVLWAADLASTALYLDLPDGDFIAVAGSFFYGAQTGADAAKAFHRDFDRTSFNWRNCSGQFTLAIGKGAELTVLNDGLAAWKLYRDSDASFVSAGFLETLLLSDCLSFDTQGVYEYVFAGYVLGENTFLEGVKAVMPNRLVACETKAGFSETEKPTPIRRMDRANMGFEDMAQLQYGLLQDRFKKLCCLPRNAITSSVSGGFDSRLMISMFKQFGFEPPLFVYGDDNDEDVGPSKTLAAYFGLPLRHVDRSKIDRPGPDAWPSAADLIFYFDGWKDDGLPGFDHDINDRKTRSTAAPFMANGKCGEIYRHYYYQKVGARGTDLDAFVGATFGRVVLQMMPTGFDLGNYQKTITKAFRAITGFGDARMSQEDLDYLYSKVRICHDAGRDLSINHRFGHALYPFIEPELCGPALALNYRERLYGTLEARMIELSDPKLLSLPSAYGYDLRHGPNWKYRAKMALSYHRPDWLRTHIPALQNFIQMQRGDVPALMEKAMLPDPSLPYLQNYFQLDAVRMPKLLSRIYMLELLAQHFSFQQ